MRLLLKFYEYSPFSTNDEQDLLQAKIHETIRLVENQEVF